MMDRTSKLRISSFGNLPKSSFWKMHNDFGARVMLFRNTMWRESTVPRVYASQTKRLETWNAETKRWMTQLPTSPSHRPMHVYSRCSSGGIDWTTVSIAPGTALVGNTSSAIFTTGEANVSGAIWTMDGMFQFVWMNRLDDGLDDA